MALARVQASGRRYLELVTTLLQSARRADATGGQWEAADLQWWWRRDQHPDPSAQTFWLDRETPSAAVVFQNWGDRLECVVLSADHNSSRLLPTLWARALEHCAERDGDVVELLIRDDDERLIELARTSGFAATDDRDVTCWMEPGERRAIPALAPDFVLVARADVADRPHHMIARNGPHIASRLGDCSLYRPELDLAIYAPGGEVAAYGLFWADPVTGVGLVEPMRTEDRFQGQGLASHLFAAGLDRLARAGCTRLKVSFDAANPPARRVYLGAGFRPVTSSQMYRREPHRP